MEFDEFHGCPLVSACPGLKPPGPCHSVGSSHHPSPGTGRPPDTQLRRGARAVRERGCPAHGTPRRQPMSPAGSPTAWSHCWWWAWRCGQPLPPTRPTAGPAWARWGSPVRPACD